MVKSIKSVKYPVNKFEILIVDDGSLLPIVRAKLDTVDPDFKINIIRLSHNQGILNALNTGLKELNERNDYNYIARLDAGDTCDTERFTKQVHFLDIHPEIVLLGTWCRFENKQTGKGFNYITKTKHEEIVKEMHFKCSFIHPTVMFRKKALGYGFYPDGYPNVEDYAYFWLLLGYFKGAVLPENLVKVDFSNENVSSKNYRKQVIYRMKIVKDFGTHKTSKMVGLFLLGCRFLLPLHTINKIKFMLKN